MIEILVFVGRDQKNAFSEAQGLVSVLARNHKARLIDKLTADLRLLELVATYGVVEPVVFLIVDANGVRVRRTVLPSTAQVEALLADMRDSCAGR